GITDDLADICRTADGGFALCGRSAIVSGNMFFDWWVLKLDQNGGVIWQKTIGGSNNDEPTSIIETANGDIVVAGRTKSTGAGDFDALVVEFDAAGNLVRQRSYGDVAADEINEIKQTSDTGYILVGTSNPT